MMPLVIGASLGAVLTYTSHKMPGLWWLAPVRFILFFVGFLMTVGCLLGLLLNQSTIPIN